MREFELETFEYNNVFFDINLAKALVKNRPANMYVPVKDIMPMITEGGIEISKAKLHSLVAQKFLDPVIVATLEDEGPGHPYYLLLIDGYHRVYFANALGVDQLPAYRLNVAETHSLFVAELSENTIADLVAEMKELQTPQDILELPES